MIPMKKHEQEKEQNMKRRQTYRQELRLAGGWDGKERNGEAAFGTLEMEFLAEISALIFKEPHHVRRGESLWVLVQKAAFTESGRILQREDRRGQRNDPAYRSVKCPASVCI